MSDNSDRDGEAENLQIKACRVCGLTHALLPLKAGTFAQCRRCGSTVEERAVNSLHRTAAFSLAALILYIPANLLPILKIDMYGATSQNTVWDGCVTLWREGDWTIATIVFLASILIPLLKLSGLFTLVVCSWLHVSRARTMRTWLHKTIEVVGRWAMLDVFVLAVLVSLVKLDKLATVLPGSGVLAFGGVVVCTLLASVSYDPQLIWEPERPRDDSAE